MAEVPRLGKRCACCHRDDPPNAFDHNGKTFCDSQCCIANGAAEADERYLTYREHLIHAVNEQYGIKREVYLR